VKRLKFDYLFYIGIVLLLLLLAAAARAQTGGAKPVKVKIYVLDVFESPNLLETLDMIAVEREVSGKFPLRFALEAQMKGATDEEISQSLFSPFEKVNLISVRVKNKTAYATFTRTGVEEFSRIDALRFRKAIRQTALQFTSVRRIDICLDGVSDFWLVGAKTHKKC
jgi:hypothetical protein